MSVKVFDPKELIIAIGTFTADGYADGTFLSIESNEDAFALSVGASGEAARSRTHNNSATITLTLMQTSATNDALSTLHNLDKATPNGDGIVPLLIKDNRGNSLFAAEHCWVKKRPTAEYGREPTGREWVLETDNLVAFDGGNNSAA